jgi:NAD(P)-dependent dehydrogenase (short-subunit alcohol dehydrogenase family)
MRALREQVVVITGASSGIGRATAEAFSRAGAAVVLAARNEGALEDVADLIHARGGRALVVPTDVSDWPEVDELARRAVAEFGRIDTWVNNAAVSEYATVEDMAIEEIERIIQVDLLGTIYGVKAALPYLRKDDTGTIINVSSIDGERSIPLQAAYCAAKHGVNGFTEALRLELAQEKSGIAVTLILPGSTNTPFFTHARTKVAGRPRPLPPVYTPEAVARAIVQAAVEPSRDVYVGSMSKALSLLQRLSPLLADRYMLWRGKGFAEQVEGRPGEQADALFERPAEGSERVHGEFTREQRHTEIYRRPYPRGVGLRRLTLAAAGAAALAALARRIFRLSHT